MKVAEYTDYFSLAPEHMNSKRHNELTGVGNERYDEFQNCDGGAAIM